MILYRSTAGPVKLFGTRQNKKQSELNLEVGMSAVSLWYIKPLIR
jgi:hypothetical protein